MAYNLSFKLTISFILFTFSSSKALSFVSKNPVEQLEEIEIIVGSTASIKSSEGSELYINRKGIIAAQYLNHGNWRIIGLKVGTTLIQSEDKSWLIHIVNKPRHIGNRTTIPKWICKKGLKCLTDELIISGSSADPFLFIKAKNWCTNQEKCLFVGTLTESAIRSLRHFYKLKLGLNYEIFIHPNGISEFFLPCNPKTNEPHKSVIRKIKQIAGLNIQQGHQLFTCKKFIPQVFKLQSKVVLVNKIAAEVIDFNTNSQVKIGTLPPSKFKGITKSIQLLINQNKGIIIGEPSLSLLEGQEGTIKSGGEFPVFIKTGVNNYSQSWKSFGLSLGATLRTDNQKILGNIEFSLSTKGTKADNSLVSSSLRTAVELQTGKETMIGSVEIKTQQSSKKENSLLGKTPLIGPFFQTREEEDTYSKLLLFVQIN